MFFFVTVPCAFPHVVTVPEVSPSGFTTVRQHQLAVLAFRAVASASQPPFYYPSSYSIKFASICLSISASLVKAPEKARRAPPYAPEPDEA